MPRFSLLVLALAALAACGSDPAGPSSRLAAFRDPQTGSTTTDVHDVDEQVMRFDTAAGTLIWAADGSSHSGWSVSGDFLDPQRMFQVRFGSHSGPRRAYFTEAGRGTICQLEVRNGQLAITPTNVLP